MASADAEKEETRLLDGQTVRAGGESLPARGGDAGLKTSLTLAAVNFANGVVGAGIVGLPSAMNQAGLPLGIATCVGVAIISQYTIRLLATVGIAQGMGSYLDLAQRAYGPVGFYVCSFFQAIFAFGAMVTYLIIFKDTMPLVIATTTGRETTPGLVLFITSLFVLLPLSLIRAFGMLARLGVIKALATVLITFTVCFYAVGLQGKVESTRSQQWRLLETHPDYFAALGTISFAFVCHHQTFLVLGSLANPTPRRFALTTAIAIFGSFALSLTMAVAGYLTFYEDTMGDIFKNYADISDLSAPGLLTTARLLLALNMVITYPGELLVARITIETVIKRVRSHYRWLALKAPVHDAYLLARIKDEEEAIEASSPDNWRFGSPISRPLLEHVAVTVALVALSCGVAAGVDDIKPILNITGATAATFLSFLLPAAIRLRLGATAHDTTPAWHISNWAPILTLAFGALAFVTSTGFALASTIFGDALLA